MGLKCQGETENNSTAHDIFASVAFLHFKMASTFLSIAQSLFPLTSKVFVSADIAPRIPSGKSRHCAQAIRSPDAPSSITQISVECGRRSFELDEGTEGTRGRLSIVKRRTDLSLNRQELGRRPNQNTDTFRPGESIPRVTHSTSSTIRSRCDIA